jgi:hypothetical protein
MNVNYGVGLHSAAGLPFYVLAFDDYWTPIEAGLRSMPQFIAHYLNESAAR